MCRVEFSKIVKRDVTFIREMRVHDVYYNEIKALLPKISLDVCWSVHIFAQIVLIKENPT